MLSCSHIVYVRMKYHCSASKSPSNYNICQVEGKIIVYCSVGTHGWTWNNSKMQRGKTASFFRLMMSMMLIATFLLLFVLSFHLSIISVLLPFEPKMMMEYAHTISCHDSPTSLSLVIIKIITLHYVNSHHMWTLFPPALRKRELKYEKMPPVILFAKSALLNTHSPKSVLHYALLLNAFSRGN